jgi:hypothetical protein
MNDTPLKGRRIALKQISMAFASLPLIAITGSAHAEKSVALRTALKYQETPNAGKECLACAQFVPGKTPKDKGGCKIMPGDTEISPTGWCSAFAPAPAKK